MHSHRNAGRAAARTAGARALIAFALLALTSACSDSPSVAPLPDTSPDARTLLAGAPSDAAVAAVPDLNFVPRREDYRQGATQLPGAMLSFNTATIAIKPGATVGAVNALLTRLRGTIVAGIKATQTDRPTVIAVRFSSTTHAEMDRIMTALAAAPEIEVASRDIQLGTTAIASSGATAADWTWIPPASAPVGSMLTGSWGLAAMRVPQIWNINEHLRAESRSVRVGVLDSGFDIAVPDLASTATGLAGLTGAPHGTEVASVIAAKFNNGDGIDGVNPFARLSLYRYELVPIDSVTSVAAAGWGLGNLLAADALARVINVSLGYNWSKSVPSISSLTNEFARETANKDASILIGILVQKRPSSRFPVIVAASGNDQGDSAKYSSPLANLALRLRFAPIIVVDADSAEDGATEVEYHGSAFSNVGGTVSAPGSRIGVVSNGNVGRRASGTSFATPNVAGVASLLLTLFPDTPHADQSQNTIRDVLVRTINTARNRNGRPQVDLFAAALDMDAVSGTRTVIRRLLDVDDGTPDGNTRVDPFTRATDTARDVKRDTLITMADFRHFRDLLLPFEFPGLSNLDGAVGHPKKDANGDGVVGPLSSEAVFPHDDFNGDGQLSGSALTAMAGTLRARGPMTDLAVMQSLWEDTLYAASELPGLIASGDIHVGLGGCVAATGERLRATVTRASGGYSKGQFFGPGADRVVFTVPATSNAAYTVTLARMIGDSVVAFRDTTVNATLGGDAVAVHGCTPTVIPIHSIRLTPTPVSLSGGQRIELTAEPFDALGRPITNRRIFYSWRNSVTAIASVFASGSGGDGNSAIVLGLSPGNTLVRAVAEGVSGSTSVTVTTFPPAMPTSSATLGISDEAGTVSPFAIRVTGGVAPYTFSLTRGTRFRNALTLSASGVITGVCGECAADPNFTTRLGGVGLTTETVSILLRDANGVTVERTAFAINFQFRP